MASQLRGVSTGRLTRLAGLVSPSQVARIQRLVYSHVSFWHTYRLALGPSQNEQLYNACRPVRTVIGFCWHISPDIPIPQGSLCLFWQICLDIPIPQGSLRHQLSAVGCGTRCGSVYTPLSAPVAGARSFRFWVTRLCHGCGGTHILTYP